ncbi:MAG: hypothetical protein KKB74_07410 [Bacteroidetes bacterium]|nr:hypothetical protein [Bacteroidota bacterium]
METKLEDLYNGLFSILNKQDKPILKKIILLHKAREKELLDEFETYKAGILIDVKEIDATAQKIKSLMNMVDQINEVVAKLKGIISKIRSLRVGQT